MDGEAVSLEDRTHQLSLYGRLLQYPVTYFAKHQSHGTIGGYARSEPAFVRAIRNLQELGYDCFCNINPTQAVAKKAKRSEVLSFSRILLDFDPVATGDGIDWERLRRDIDLVEMECTSVIHTGRGIHLYLHLTPIVLTNDEHRLNVERATAWFLRGIAAALPDNTGARLDVTTSDLARVARCPGTINSKCGRRAQLLQVAKHRMPLSFTEDLLRNAPRQRLPEPKVGASCDSSNLFQLLPHLTELAQRYLCEGAPEGRRHHDAFATARSLREHGVPQDRALTWVQLGGSRCSPDLKPEECIGPVQSAYR